MSVVEFVDKTKVNVKERHIREESRDKKRNEEEKEEKRRLPLKMTGY
jgi:hypothetical protein